MRVIVTGRNTRVSKVRKEMAIEKVEKVRRYFDRVQTLEIEFSEEHNPRIADKHRVEVTLTTKANVLRAHASAPDPATAVDRVVAKLQRQVRRLKEKIVDRGHGAPKGGHAARPKAATAAGTRSPRARKAKVSADGALAEAAGAMSENGFQLGLESDGKSGGVRAAPAITEVKRFSLKPMTAEEAVLQMESLKSDFYLFLDADSEQAGVVYRKADGTFGLIESDK